MKNRSEVGSIVMSYLRDLDMTPSIFGHSLRKEYLITSTKFQRDPPSASAAISENNSCWGASSLPAPSLYVARGLTSNGGQLGKLKEFLFKYCLSDHPKTFRIMLRWATLGELCAKDSDLWHDLEPDLPTPGLT